MKDTLKKELAKVIRANNKKGWSPATSTNYSFRSDDDLNTIVVSRSGVDKANFTNQDFIEVDVNGVVLPAYVGLRPSAETGIHCTLYELFPEARVILHSHSVYPVLWSMHSDSFVNLEGFEVQKGFEGQTTHENHIQIPIFENSQNMQDFKNEMASRKVELGYHCFIIKGHGAYAWGKDLFQAKRHLETLDYLCEITWKLK